MNEIRIEPVDPTLPAIVDLLAELDEYQLALYPPGSLNLTPAEILRQRGAFMLGATMGGRLVGCGCYVRHADGWGELKRMYVRAEARGHGVGRRILEALETHARAAGVLSLRLETGVHQPIAIALYERAGYMRRGIYGDYAEDPLGVYMEKWL